MNSEGNLGSKCYLCVEFIREEFKCLGNCPICEKCSFLGDARLKTSMPTPSKVTVPSRTSRQNKGILATLSGLDREEVDKASPRFVGDAGLAPCIPTV